LTIGPGGGGADAVAARWSAANAAKQSASSDGLAIGIASGAYDQRAGEDAPPSATGTSIFDPVLCEIAYRWFCPPGGLVLDPFAGGSVRGIVAAKLGRRYLGIELREEQVAANNAQRAEICAESDTQPSWLVGDSREIEDLTQGVEADFIFSCPPYADLERYSDDPADLSAMKWDDFQRAYREIISATCALLRPDRFACFVVGDVRDKKTGFYRGLPALTTEAFIAGGARLYNQAILVTAVGSLPLRVSRQFEASRKLGNTHQHVLVYCKGDPKAATTAVGECEFGAIDEQPPTEDSQYGERMTAADIGL